MTGASKVRGHRASVVPTRPTGVGDWVPAWLDGAWVRQRRLIDGGDPTEPSDVVWLQAGPWFADLRLARSAATPTHGLDRSQAFSGRLEVVDHLNASVATWHHDLDTVEAVERTLDTASLVLCEGEMVETGVGYVEWWRRLDEGTERRVLVLEHADSRNEGPESDRLVDARIVCSGSMAIAVWVGVSRGGLWSTAPSGWEPERVVGELPRELDVIGALHAALSEMALPDQWRAREV